MKPLPLSKQSFRAIRREDFLYVDKTEHIWRMARYSRQYFLSRPRRFGKSLTIETLRRLFMGEKELFEGLWIYDHWDWTKSFPVIHIAFNEIGYLTVGLEKALHNTINSIAAEHQLTLEAESYDQRFAELVRKMGKDQGVVILIDEYDKPLIDYLNKENLHQAKENREILKAFYGVLKGADDYLRFLLITGVSKFSRVSIFSDLNHLIDLTINTNFTTLTGYTQEELEQNFDEYLVQYSQEMGIEKAAMLEKIRQWYDGYTWDGKNHVYNPWSVMTFFNGGGLSNHWFQTGTPTFLIKLLKERFFYDFEKVETSNAIFESYDLENLETVALLFQTGYLTISSKEEEDGTYILDYPNKEVKESMLRHLLGGFSHSSSVTNSAIIRRLAAAMRRQDMTAALEILDGFFQAIPADIFIANREEYYHSVVYLAFMYLGLFVEAEVHTGKGHLDAAVTTADRIFIFEFKLDHSAEVAMEQIHRNNYAARYRHKMLPITAIGVNFSSAQKRIGEWKTEEL